MSNQLAVLPFYLAWQSLVPQNYSGVTVINVGQTPPESRVKLATEIPAGYAVYPDEGVAYKLYRDVRPWDDARKYCNGEGADLAVIDSFQKAEYVMDLKGPKTAPDIHVGIHRFTDDNEYVQVKTGSPPAILPWLETGQINDQSRKCVVIPFTGGGIVASHCQGLYHFVCEISIFKN